MAEYIEKDAILSKCEEMWNNADETTQTGVDTINAIDRITDFIEAMPVVDVQPVKMQSVNRWISVDEALPVIERRVLVYYPNWIDVDEEYQVAHLEETYGCGIQFVTYDGVRLPTVTHWKPLPEPPKGGDAE